MSRRFIAKVVVVYVGEDNFASIGVTDVTRLSNIKLQVSCESFFLYGSNFLRLLNNKYDQLAGRRLIFTREQSSSMNRSFDARRDRASRR